MKIFQYDEMDQIGVVSGVDTATITIVVGEEDKLRGLQVNHLLVIRSSKVGQHLIAIVTKILRKSMFDVFSANEDDENLVVENIVKATLIGTHLDSLGSKTNIFKRTLESVAEINADCFLLNGEYLTRFMNSISNQSSTSTQSLSLGKYILDENSKAWLDGNKFFQRHAVIVGSTGSGKSWSVATVLEQVAKLKSSNAIVFDIHGEYGSMVGDGFQHYKIAGPNEQVSNNIMFLPYWFLTYEEMISLLLDRSDNNAPNQAMLFSNAVLEGKKEKLIEEQKIDEYNTFTLDSPIPYDMNKVIEKLHNFDIEKVDGARSPKNGPYNGKLTHFVQRLKSKKEDKRLNFLFTEEENCLKMDYLDNLLDKFVNCNTEKNYGVKIIDFSEVPSDILPLIIGLVSRIIFSVQQWTARQLRHPIAFFCDEAHLYIPSTSTTSIDCSANRTFERIAKEGRKYGIGLVIISQRPSEVNKTVMSQCNNFISLRLTNVEDQNVIKKLLPDSLGNFGEILPILDIGEALVVGDASLLPSRIRINIPKLKPTSATIDFWDEWARTDINTNVSLAIKSLRKQLKQN
jgi:hypothetical protein